MATPAIPSLGPSVAPLQPQYSALTGNAGGASLNVSGSSGTNGMTTGQPSPSLSVVSSPSAQSLGPSPAVPNLFATASPVTPQVGASALSTPSSQGLTVQGTPPTQPVFNTTYGQLVNNGGTIKDSVTGKVYSNPAQLAADLGIPASQIQWGQIKNAPAAAASSIQTAPSGTVVNGNTGSVVQPVDTGAGSAGIGAAPASPAVPSTSTDPYSSNPLYTSPAYQQALAAYQASVGMSPAEIQATQQLNDLNSELGATNANIESQSIPIEGIVGQQKAAQDRVTALETPIESQLTLAQAQRQAEQQAAQFQVTAAQNQIAGYQALNKPVAVDYGGSLVNPQSGAVVSPAFGGASGGSGINPSTGLAPNASAADILGYLTTNGIDSSKYNVPGLLAAIQNGATADDIISGRANVAATTAATTDAATATPKALAASLTQQQQYLDTTTRSLSTANSNLSVLQGFMTQYGLNDSSVPLINQLTNKVKAGLLDPGVVAAFNTQVQDLRSEYAQVLAKGGTVTDTSRNEAQSLIPDDLSPAQLQQVATQIQADGSNAVASAQAQVNAIQASLKAAPTTNFGTSSSQSAPAATSSSDVGWF